MFTDARGSRACGVRRQSEAATTLWISSLVRGQPCRVCRAHRSLRRSSTENGLTPFGSGLEMLGNPPQSKKSEVHRVVSVSEFVSWQDKARRSRSSGLTPNLRTGQATWGPRRLVDGTANSLAPSQATSPKLTSKMTTYGNLGSFRETASSRHLCLPRQAIIPSVSQEPSPKLHSNNPTYAKLGSFREGAWQANRTGPSRPSCPSSPRRQASIHRPSQVTTHWDRSPSDQLGSFRETVMSKPPAHRPKKPPPRPKPRPRQKHKS